MAIQSNSPSSPPAPRRKRLSLHQSVATGGRHSNTDSPGSSHGSALQPSRIENIMNDDAAEKASRRKSAHFGDLASGRGEGSGSTSTGDSSRGPSGAQGKRAVSALAVQNQLNSSTTANGREKRQKRISAVGVAGVAGVPAPVALEVNSTKFEEWMKLATDNKITATNTWNFALIDYFADLTLLRNDEDQSINFQKASCTLDGCVKIWTSRVDSVATETGKLLSGLAGGDAEDQGDAVDGEDEEGGEARPTRKTTHRSEATMAKSFDALKIKKFDLEFSVDPLFKKTKEDFDEGGAMGLLLNHLGVDGKGRLVFDAGDATVGDDEDVLEPADEDMLDLSHLREYIPSVKRLQSLNISDTLASFKFSSDPSSMPDFSTLLGLKDTFEDDISAAPAGEGLSMVQEEEADFFGGEDFDSGAPMPGGFDEGGGDDDGEGGGGAFASSSHMGQGGTGMAGPGEHMAFDGRKHAGDLVMALAGGDDGEGMFDYFDKGFAKNWAGAEHWKLRKVTRKDTSVTTAPKVPKAVKAAFTIDFTAPPPSTKTLFATSSKSSITLPKAKRQKREEFLLPDDMHFSSRQLLRLSLKPKYALRVKRNAQPGPGGLDTNEEVDETFWARAAAERAEGGEGFTDLDGGNGSAPFETQFFNDDGDGDDGGDFGFGADSPLGGGGGIPNFEEDDDLWAGTQGQQLKRIRPENVHFAKKAKRVDVKRLKDDIWTGLRSLVPESEQEGIAEAEESITPVGEAKQFDKVIQSLRESYPQDKMSEISTSFCFICLLHLANEEGLRIETARFDDQEGLDVGCVGEAEEVEQEYDAYNSKRAKSRNDGERKDRIVGELQALKVYKDPTAGRAA